MNPQLSVMTMIRGGVFSRADARACGYPDADIDTLLAGGGWRRVRAGTYAPFRDFHVVGAETTHVRRAYHLLHRGPSGVVASHQSAAALHALPLWNLDLSQVHLTIRTSDPPPAPPRRPPGSEVGPPWEQTGPVRLHERETLGPGIMRWNGVRLVSPARAAAEIAATAPLPAAVAVADAALHARLTTRASLRRAAAQLVADAERARRVLARASGESASVAETRLRLILGDAGLPAPSSCPPPTATDGEQAACSLWFPDQRTVVEFEPHRPYWTDEYDESAAEAADRAFGAPRPGLPDDPQPVECCYVSWSDLDDPTHVAQLVRTTFARASRRTGVRVFDPHRRRRRAATSNSRGRMDRTLPTPC